MLGSETGMQQPCHEPGIQHLIELGYIDPVDVAAREAAAHRPREIELQQVVRLAAEGKPDDAAERLARLTAEDPDWVAPREALADVLFRAGRFDDAQAQLDWLTCHGVEQPRLAFMAGAIALLRRDLGSALESLDYARTVEPQLPGVHALFGTTLLRLGKLADAEEAFRQAIDANPSDARPYSGLATICMRRGQYDEAADWALQAVEANALLFQSHYQLGVALVRMKRPHEAVHALEASIRIDPTRIAPYRWLAQIAESALQNPTLALHYRDRGHVLIRQRRAQKGTKLSSRSASVSQLADKWS